jgi:hypothetical protein
MAEFVAGVMNRGQCFFNRFASFHNLCNRCVDIFHVTPHHWFVRSIIPNNAKNVKKKAAEAA